MQLALVAAALIGAAPNPDQMMKDLPGLSSPPTEAVSTEMDGMLVTQRSATSKKPVAELRAHFLKVFEKAGLYLPPEQDRWQPEIGEQVTGLDTENLVTYTALLQPNGKSVTVVLAMGNVGAKKDLPPDTMGLPVYPNAGPPTRLDVETTKAFSYAAKATPAELKAFYREALPKLGWREQDQSLTFVKGAQQVRVTVSPGVSERYVLLQLEARAAQK